MEINPSKYPTLRTRLAITLIVLAALFSLGVSSVLYMNFRQELRESLRHRLENITALSGLQQDGDTFIKVQAQNDESFQKIHEANLRIKTSEPDLRFVYTMRKEMGNIYFVVDAGLPGEPDISAFGDPYLNPSQTLIENFESMTGTIVESDFYTDEFGTFLSAYTPIYTSDGQRVGVLGVDITASTVLAQERVFLSRIILIFLASLPFLVVAGIFSANFLAKPIVGLRNMVNKVSEGDYSFKIINIPHTREPAELALDFNLMTEKLSGLIYGLEQRVKERTESLTRKSDQLRAVSQIVRKTSEVLDLSTLLDMVATLVAEQFDFYHTGIFLASETGEEVILQAASSEGGRRMINKGYSLAVDQPGVIGFVASEKKSRIAMDVGSEAVFFNNPDLPMTRSELALPLLIRDRLLGVLDIQSDKPMDFSVDDMDVLQTLADQVAVSIENARLLNEFQAALVQLEAVTGERTRQAWYQKLHGKVRVFTYTPLGLRAEKLPMISTNILKVPLVLRGQKIGGISIARKGDVPLSKNEADLVAEVANQAGQAIDNLRLLEEATQRASQEQIIGRLAGKFSQSLDTDMLLQTAVSELTQLLDISEVSVIIQRQTDESPLASNYGRTSHNERKQPNKVSSISTRGYRFDGTRLKSVEALQELEVNAMLEGATLYTREQNDERQMTIAIPIRLRGQVIGVISMKMKEDNEGEMVSTVEMASDRLAAALESARLYEEARLRADREQSIAQITSAISASISYDEILQTTVREIGNTLRDTEITIQIMSNPQEQE